MTVFWLHSSQKLNLVSMEPVEYTQEFIACEIVLTFSQMNIELCLFRFSHMPYQNLEENL